MPRPDFSEYVAHFTKNASPFGAKEHKGAAAIASIKGNAYDRLISILKSTKILATPQGRMALDGVLAHVAGAGRGNFNYRFCQPSRDAQPTSSLLFPTDIFPFTGRAGGF